MLKKWFLCLVMFVPLVAFVQAGGINDSTLIHKKPVDGQREYLVYITDGKKNITSESYLLINKKKLTKTDTAFKESCFKIMASSTDVLPLTIVTKNNGTYSTKIIFGRNSVNNTIVNIPVLAPGEKYHYHGVHKMLNKTYKDVYFVKGSISDSEAISKLIRKHSRSVESDSNTDIIMLKDAEAIAAFKKNLADAGIKATLETATKDRYDGWEIRDKKIVPVAMAQVSFNADISDAWIIAAFKKLGIQYYNKTIQDESHQKTYGNCMVYNIELRTNLYDVYMKVFDALWSMKEVKTIEQIHFEEYD